MPFALPHGFVGLPTLPSSQPGLTVPLVRPKIIVFGFAAAGSAGKASVAGLFALPVAVGGLDVGRDEAGDGFVDDTDDAIQGVAPTRPAPTLLADGAGIEGNGFALAVFPQLPFLLTAERDDWAVEFFSLRTRWPPLPAAAADEPGRTPLGPGNEG